MHEAFKKNLEIKNNNKGRGLYAKVDFPANSVIYEFFGDIFTFESLPAILKPEDDFYVQIGKDTYLGPSGSLDDCINHSCNPNCALMITGNRALLKSLYLITKGTEITIDYSLTSTETKEQWQMNCICGYSKCRKIISGFQYLDKDLKDYYKSLGAVPKYVLKEEKE
jgi:SET domain-containing protein